jgi:hypothetical protein
MRTSATGIAIAFAVGACFAPLGALAFDSGSTGADGAFNPTVTPPPIDLPESGIFNFTTVNIPAGVTVTFKRNTANTPVVILASGNVTIAGSINVSGGSAPSVGAIGDGVTGDDGVNGLGGPGGFDGGRGGLGATNPYDPNSLPQLTVRNRGGSGLGPGGGESGYTIFYCGTTSPRTWTRGGRGGGFALASAGIGTFDDCGSQGPAQGGGGTYGSDQALPLIGGSGGGGGGGGRSSPGAGGGGGGGALLIAASGTVSITGSVLANGGNGGSTATGWTSNCEGNTTTGPIWGGPGGGGSGGAIRIVATTITGNGPISANLGAAGGVVNNCVSPGATNGSVGRIRLEGEVNNHNGTRTGSVTASAPGPVFVAGTPTLRIASVAGVNAPATPTGNADITLPAATPNPVTVVFETRGVPVGNTVQVIVTPAYGAKSSAITPALTGTTELATASASVNLPAGPSVLEARTTYTVVAALGDLLKNFAGNERVEKVTLLATLGGPSKARLITVSGKEYEVPAEVLRLAAFGG